MLVRALLLVLCIVALVGCAALEQATNTQTYVISSQQYTAIQEMLGITSCPEGQTAVAFAAELRGGGGTLTVRCQ